MAPPATQPLVFIVDDDTAVRTTVCALLKSMGIATRPLASAQEFLSDFEPSQPGCVVLDIRMPGMSGLEMQEQLNRLGAIIPVIFVTGHGDVPMAVGAMRHGAFDFLQKPFREQDLLDCVQRALARDRENRLELQEHGLIRERLASLTPREAEVLRLMTEGKANKVIANELRLSQRTVELHRAHVMEKMGAHSLAQLVRMVMDTQP
jgi:two-component system, LuxR family, response regulator FixJ